MGRMKRASEYEQKFFMIISQGIVEDVPIPEAEYMFCNERKWRLDFAWPEVKLGVEIEGGEWSRGAHVRGKGFIEDINKYNRAAELGWIVLRYSGTHMKDEGVKCVEQVKRVLEMRGKERGA